MAVVGFSSLPLVTCAAAMVVAAHLVCGWRVCRQALRLMRPIWIFVTIILLWQSLSGDVWRGVEIALRIVVLVAAANLVTMTTPLQAMMQAVAAGLGHIGVPAGLRAQMAIAVALVISFVPQISARARHLRLAWRARSTRPAGWRLALPLALSAVDAADQVGEALRARGGVDDPAPAPLSTEQDFGT
ncbi:Cobalt transport protein [Ketogulonicigenium robustum]|uniref:Cobalt transport protein n=1 Tax=Ketogulonicigenium robustum TaxID=92947 RepID=A0A1W6NY83_9RHOB|nr:Cobalt transport protein [Ketogulonicigenium robustum]